MVERDLGITYSYDQARAAGVYSSQRRNTVSQYVLRSKRDRSAAPILADVMSFVIRTEFPHLGRADVVAAVPMTQEALHQKGFSHSLELAKHLAKLLGLPLAPDALAKNREPVKSQHESSLRERFDNVKGCFSVDDLPRWAETVLLIDDTYVTGASVNECAAILKAHGAVRVFVMCAARGVLVSERALYLEEYFDA
jgi:predicted amidophosphoribosyltransferase